MVLDLFAGDRTLLDGQIVVLRRPALLQIA